jgi:argininosuccinate synthase
MDRLITRIDELRSRLAAGERCIYLFSGGLDGSFLLAKLPEHLRRGSLALTVDLGGGVDKGQVAALAKTFGVGFRYLDNTNAFLEDYALPAIWAQARYLGDFPVSASLSRPMIASVAVEIARAEGFDIIVHTSTSTQNSLRRFNGAMRDLEFGGWYGSPFASGSPSREEKIQTLKARGLDVFDTRASSNDFNIWGWEVESGEVDDPETFSFEKVKFPSDEFPLLEEPISLRISFEKGRPVALEGKLIELSELVRILTREGQNRRIGRYVGVEEIANGRKVQEVREMPAATILFTAYRYLETGCIPAETIRVKRELEQVWVREAVEGRWFSLLRKATQDFLAAVANKVSGDVCIILERYSCRAESMRATNPLYLRDRSSYEGIPRSKTDWDADPLSQPRPRRRL